MKVQGQQRTDSSHVLAAVRELNQLENVGQTLRHALNSLATVASEWLMEQVTPEWYERYGPRFEQYRLPKNKREQQALAEGVGADGYHLLSAVYAVAEVIPWLAKIPAVEVLRWVWVWQFGCDEGQIRQCKINDMPLAGECVRSPFDIEARHCTKGLTGWVGYKVHLTEACDLDNPHLITQVETTVATVQGCQVTDIIQDDLAAIDLLPAEHLVDAGYVDAPNLAYSKRTHDIDLIGPAPRDNSWQTRAEDGLSAVHFTIDWTDQIVTCLESHASISWQHAHSQRSQPVIRVLFRGRLRSLFSSVTRFQQAQNGHKKTHYADICTQIVCRKRLSNQLRTLFRRPLNTEVCRVCGAWKNCARGQARGLTLRPRGQHEALQAARHREQTEAFKEKYRKQAGVEGTVSQATRVTGLQRSRYIGVAKTHLQNIASAAALNLARVVDWPNGVPFAATRKSRFAALAA